MNKISRDISLSFYIAFVLLLALVALGMSFISDGPVPMYVHIIMPLMIVLIFIAPLLIWRKLNAGPISSPLPTRLRKHQDKIIVIFLAVWAIGIAISYFASRGN